ncbi:MAG: hypothetical protein CL840_04075 [Crocinitomicaceae bacterium]|nr:hypothetical protein [Crocinitomicaceae bacterium]
MANQPKKGVQITLPKSLAERFSFLRRLKHRAPNLNRDMEKLVEEFVSSMEDKLRIDKDSWRRSKSCPKCSTGVLFIKRKKNDPSARPFYGCSHFPECRHTENAPEQTNHRKKK